jgi:competence protein ComEC
MNWQKVPFLRILLPIIIGIVFCEYTHTSHQGPIIFGIGIGGLYTILYLFKIRLKNKPKLILNIFLQLLCLIGGILLHTSHQEFNHQSYFKNCGKGIAFYWVQIKEIERQDSKRLKAVVDVLSLKNHSEKPQKCNGKALIYINDVFHKFEIGDWLLVHQEPQAIEAPKYPWQFDYQSYAKNKKIYHQFFIKHPYKHIKCHFESISKSAYNSKKRIETIVKSKFSKKEDVGLVLALLTGDKSALNEEMKSNFSKTGTMHVLAVSGLHVALVFSLLNFVFLTFKKLPFGNYLHLILVLSGLWYFAFITGLGNSVLRASMMFSLAQAAILFKRKNNSMNSLLACAFILLYFNSNVLFDVGFQLSFAAVLGIIYSQLFEYKHYGRFQKVKKYLMESLKISLFAQLFTLPIILYNFHQFPIYFLLSNLLIIPLTSLLMYGLIAHLLLNGICSISNILTKFNSNTIHLMNKINETIGNFRFAVIEQIDVTSISAIIIYVVILLTLKSILLRKKKMMIYGYTLLCITMLQNQIVHCLNRQKTKTYKIENNLYVSVRGQDICVLKKPGKTKQNSFKKLEKQIENSHLYVIKNNIDLTKSLKTAEYWIKKDLGFQIFDTIMTSKYKK